MAIEILLTTGNKGNKYFPDSGPGTKTLTYGTEDLGFFGLVSTEELMDFNELRRQTEFWSGNAQNNSNNEWVKCFFNKKVLFIPKRYIGSAVSWDQLYAKGIVLGIDGVGAYPAAAGAVNQLKLVFGGGSTFKVRLLAADLEPDPTGTTGVTWGTAATRYNLSEAASIICSLKAGAPASWPGPKWAVVTADSFFNGVSGVTQRTIGSNVQQNQTCTNAGTSVAAKSSVSGAWLPVLELVPNDQVPLLPMANVVTQQQSSPAPVILTELIQDVGFQAIRKGWATDVSPLPVVLTAIEYS